MKSINISSYSVVSISISYSSPYSTYVLYLFFQHTIHFLIYTTILSFILLKLQFYYTSSIIYLIPRYPTKGLSQCYLIITFYSSSRILCITFIILLSYFHYLVGPNNLSLLVINNTLLNLITSPKILYLLLRASTY